MIQSIEKDRSTLVKGIAITLLIGLVAKYLAYLPVLSIFGQLVIAILLGMIVRMFLQDTSSLQAGITFSSKTLLRLGIVLLGLRLNLVDIYQAGLNVFLYALLNLFFALFLVLIIARVLGVERNLSILTASGTAICGAAAVGAVGTQMKAKADEIAIGTAIIALLGTVFTFIYTLLYPFLGLTPSAYGIFAGGTLHEVAHVVAAAEPGGAEAVDLALIVKLTRVALLIPIAIGIGVYLNKQTQGRLSSSSKGSVVSEKFLLRRKRWTNLPIPWFILGFLAMSGINTLQFLPETIVQASVSLSYLLISMAMAGLGLNVHLGTFKRLGMKPLLACALGSVLLSFFGYCLLFLLRLN